MPKQVNHLITEITFKDCPFCGEVPNVFEAPETRYGKTRPYGWVVECKSMGCIVDRTTPDQSLDNLRKRWNERKSIIPKDQ